CLGRSGYGPLARRARPVGEVGAAASERPRRAQLSVAHPGRRRRTVVWLPDPILVIPAQAREEPAVVDDTSRAWACYRALPLAEPSSFGTRALLSSNVSGRLHTPWGSPLCTATGWKRGTVCSCRDSRARDSPPAPRRPRH